jgi:hypothetical protein
MLNHYDSWLGPMIIWYYLLMMVIGSNVYIINGVDIIVRWVFVIFNSPSAPPGAAPVAGPWPWRAD